MDKFQAKIGEIKSKVQKLLSLHADTLKQLEQLKSEHSALKAELEKQQFQVKELKEKSELLQMSNTIQASSKDTKALRIRVNELIREVDKCISLLNN